ncbi:MAG: T9SS type A sorting domain-containing protein [Paludibacter sp.]|nr:T9SS type A sorting domain-containing protein [Paludibacter sp.]
MKKLIGILMISFICNVAFGADLTGKRIYINPGHGGFDANDRNVQTINFAMADTLGFWESKSNLLKATALRNMLQAAGATVYMSRTRNRTEDDRLLSEIAGEANANNVDAFLSIHSNAIGTNTGTNYLLLLFHGRDNSPKIPQSLAQCNAAWPRLINNKLTVWTHYTTSTNIRGDTTFYGTYGLGVLTPLTVPGFLSEGSFHDYKPETHRLLNPDYCRLEAMHFYRFYCDYFQSDLPTKGLIAGHVRGKDETLNHAQYIYKAATDDRWLPLNNARVKLMNAAGDSLAGYKVDSLYNGIFMFHDLNPGTYKLRFDAKDHTSKDTTVIVAAAATTYAKMLLVNPNLVVAKDTTPNYTDPVQEAGVVPLNNYQFGTATPAVPEWLNPNQIKKLLYRNEKLYVLTTEPKIIIANAVTNAKISEMSLTGLVGGASILSDIAFTSDGYLLGCNRDTVSLPELKSRFFKVYTWDTDSDAPKLLFQTQSQGNWSNGVMGETFAVSGSRWKCTIYTTSVTTGTSKAIRPVGLLYEEGITSVGYKYMLDAINYTEALWGRKFTFTISPTANDHFYLDSEKVLPTEFQFDWTKPDRDPLVNKGTFVEKSGYTIQPVASGNFYFRHAKNVFMASPVCNADSTAVGVVLFNISQGLNNAAKVSAKLPDAGMGMQKATYMAAAAKVTGYDIELIILAQNQGIARYKTLVPAAKANIYASELKAEAIAGGYNLKFTLNENANNVTLNINNGSTLVRTINAGALTKGPQSVAILSSDLPEGTFTWNVTAVSDALDRPLKFSDNTQPQLQFYSPRGVAVDNNIDSPFFGRVYASETLPGTVTNRTTQDGIYILNAALQDVTGQGANGYAGGVTWAGASSPMRVSVGEDSKVYLCDWSDTNPGVWIMDPANPAAAFKPVFSGLTIATGLASKNGVNVHGAISHCWVTGTGENTKLFTFDKYYVDAVATNRGNLLQYNIGNLGAPWQVAPSAVVYDDGINGNLQQNYNSCIAPDGRGGWWISQYRAEDAVTIPSLIHVKPNGSVSFNSGKTPLLIGNSYTGGMAVNPEGTVIAMGCNNEVKVYAINFDTQGVPSLTLLHSIKPAMGTNSAGLAYDRAGNLYVISNTSERLGVWAMPKTVNQFTTPAPAAQRIIINFTGIEPIINPSDLIKVFPNPARDFITIEAQGTEMQRIELYDLKGQLIVSQILRTNRTELKLSDLQSGVYLLKVKTEAGIATKRILKN